MMQKPMAVTQILREVETRTVLGVPVACLTMDAAVAKIDSLIGDGGSHIVATADASGIVIAQTDPELMAIYHEASLVTPDSYGVVWGVRRAGGSTERVSGVDVANALCALSSQKGYRVYLLGAEPGVPEAAAERLALLHPGINICGTHHGYFPPSEDSFVAEEVAKAKPDVLLVAMGIPRQEKFIHETLGAIKPKVAMGVGGTLDVFSGRAKRAPVVIQKLRLEWLWRTLLNPKKISKARTLPKFAWLLLTSKRPER